MKEGGKNVSVPVMRKTPSATAGFDYVRGYEPKNTGSSWKLEKANKWILP